MTKGDNTQRARLNIALAGCGKMGSALLRGWIAAGIKADYTVIEPSKLPAEFAGRDFIHHIISPGQDIVKSDIVVLAIKPQTMKHSCAALKAHIKNDALVISIAAGQSLSNLEKLFSHKLPIIRAMPNTPAAIGKGITVGVANKNVSYEQRLLADELLATAGQMEWTTDESLLDAVTALSGSGPAYVFYLIEALTKAGTEIGLPADLAQKLARQTVIGSAALAAHEKDTSAATLRQNVTSPGGTTEAALKILMNGELENIFIKALDAAKKRGEELNS